MTLLLQILLFLGTVFAFPGWWGGSNIISKVSICKSELGPGTWISNVDEEILTLMTGSGAPSRLVHVQNNGNIGKLEYSGRLGHGLDGVVERYSINNQEFAVKRVPYSAGRYDYMHLCYRIPTEISVWRQLDHPNIIPLLSWAFVVNKNEWLMVMPVATLGGLDTYVNTLTSQQERDFVFRPRFRHILDALKYLENLGICHGDVVVKNILVQSDSTFLLSDFAVSYNPYWLKRKCNDVQALKTTYRNMLFATSHFSPLDHLLQMYSGLQGLSIDEILSNEYWERPGASDQEALNCYLGWKNHPSLPCLSPDTMSKLDVVSFKSRL